MRFYWVVYFLFSLTLFWACGSSTDSNSDEDAAVTIDLSYQNTVDLNDEREGDGSAIDIPDATPEVGDTRPDPIDDAEVEEDLGEGDVEVTEEIVECAPDCSERACGPDPICGELCGTCDDPDFPACNDGVCEFTCNETACSAQTYCLQEECEPNCVGEDCTPEELCSTSGLETCYVYSCSEAETCDLQIELGEACTRETQDDVVSAESLGECTGTDVCSASGEQTILATICEGGEPTSEPAAIDSQSCELAPTRGDVLSVDPGSCSYPDDSCSVQGSRTESTTRCDGVGGTTLQERTIRDESCVRSVDTETSIGESLGRCGGFSDVCDITGSQTRTRTYCDGDGGTVEREDSVACSRSVSSDTTLGEAEYGRCSGFGNVCDTTGTRSVSQTYCTGDGGSEAREGSEACSRTVDTVTAISGPELTRCEGYSHDCDTTGTQTATYTYCNGSGGTTTRDGTQSCTRTVSASTVYSDVWTACSYADAVCSAQSTATRTTTLCDGSGGFSTPTTRTETRTCSTETASCTSCPTQTVDYQGFIDGTTRTGACTQDDGHVCTEDGSQTVSGQVCSREGGRTNASTTQDCFWDSQGDNCAINNITNGNCDDELCCDSRSATTTMAVSTDITVVTTARGNLIYEDQLLAVGTEASSQYFGAVRFNTGGINDSDDIHYIDLYLTPAARMASATTVYVYPIRCGATQWTSTSFPCEVDDTTQLAKMTFSSMATGHARLATSLSQLSRSGIAIVRSNTTQNITFFDEEKGSGEAEPHLVVSYSLCE